MAAEFQPPGPGRWQLDRSHFTGGTTPIMLWLLPSTGRSSSMPPAKVTSPKVRHFSTSGLLDSSCSERPVGAVRGPRGFKHIVRVRR